jgi:hypothetical protein
MRRSGERSAIDAFRTAPAASRGMPGTRTSAGAASGETSTRRTPFWESASTNAAWGNVALRSSGLTWKRSATSTMGASRFATWNARAADGVTKTARLCAWRAQNSSSSASSSSTSRTLSMASRSIEASASCSSASAARLLNSSRSRLPSSSGEMGR